MTPTEEDREWAGALSDALHVTPCEHRRNHTDDDGYRLLGACEDCEDELIAQALTDTRERAVAAERERRDAESPCSVCDAPVLSYHEALSAGLCAKCRSKKVTE